MIDYTCVLLLLYHSQFIIFFDLYLYNYNKTAGFSHHAIMVIIIIIKISFLCIAFILKPFCSAHSGKQSNILTTVSNSTELCTVHVLCTQETVPFS